MAEKPFPFSVCKECCATGGGGSGDITIDKELSLSSENAVQNKVVTKELNEVKSFALTANQDADMAFQKATYIENEIIPNLRGELAHLTNRVATLEGDYGFFEAELENIVALQNSYIGGESV